MAILMARELLIKRLDRWQSDDVKQIFPQQVTRVVGSMDICFREIDAMLRDSIAILTDVCGEVACHSVRKANVELTLGERIVVLKEISPRCAQVLQRKRPNIRFNGTLLASDEFELLYSFNTMRKEHVHPSSPVAAVDPTQVLTRTRALCNLNLFDICGRLELPKR